VPSFDLVASHPDAMPRFAKTTASAATTCAYEEERLANIARNRERMAALGVLDAARDIARAAHAERLAAAEKMSVEEERAKYRALQEQLAHKALDQEGEARKRHDELMGVLVLEREQQLAEMDAAWRKNVAKAEMSHLRDETAAYRKAAEEREAAYAAREREQLEKIENMKVGVAGVLAGEPPAPKTLMEVGKISGEAERGSEIARAARMTADDELEPHALDAEDSPVSGASPEGSPPKPADAGAGGEGE